MCCRACARHFTLEEAAELGPLAAVTIGVDSCGDSHISSAAAGSALQLDRLEIWHEHWEENASCSGRKYTRSQPELFCCGKWLGHSPAGEQWRSERVLPIVR